MPRRSGVAVLTPRSTKPRKDAVLQVGGGREDASIPVGMATVDRRRSIEANGSDDYLHRLAVAAASRTAADLMKAGFDQVWSEGAMLRARRGRVTFQVTNCVSRGVPGAVQQMQECYAAMVVANLLSGEGPRDVDLDR